LAATQQRRSANSISPAAEFDGARCRAVAAGEHVKRLIEEADNPALYLMMSGGMM
jgi:hypothetical protein